MGCVRGRLDCSDTSRAGRRADRVHSGLLHRAPAAGQGSPRPVEHALGHLHRDDPAGRHPGGRGGLFRPTVEGVAWPAGQGSRGAAFRDFRAAGLLPLGGAGAAVPRLHQGCAVRYHHRLRHPDRRRHRPDRAGALVGRRDHGSAARGAGRRGDPGTARDRRGRHEAVLEDGAGHRPVAVPVDHSGGVAQWSDDRRRPAAGRRQEGGGGVLVLPGHPDHGRGLCAGFLGEP